MSDDTSIKAARLADHFITVILETKPELLVGNFPLQKHDGTGKPPSLNVHNAQMNAMALAEFRAQLTNSLTSQALPDPE